MARLPDFTSLGTRDPNSVRGLPTYDGRDYQAEAQAKLGSAISNAGAAGLDYLKDEQGKAGGLQSAQASALYQTGRIKLNNERDDETDPEKLKAIADRHKELLETAAAAISDPEKRELFRLAHSPDIETQRGQVDTKSFNLKKDAALADTFTRLTDLQQTAASAKTDEERAKAIAAGQGLIQKLREGDYITEEDSAKRQRSFANGYAVAAFERVSPEDRLAALQGAPKDRSGIVDRIIGVESGGVATAKNPNSSATGLGQFTTGTWLATVKSHRPDLLEGRSTAQVLALRNDPALSREMTGHLVDDNGAALKGAGLPVTPGSIYLSHFLGSGGASAVLKAAPGTPVSDVLGQDQIEANRSILAGKTVDTVKAWANRKMGVAGQGGKLVEFLTPGQQDAQRNAAEREITYEDRQAVAATRAEAASTNTLIKDDEASIATTGKPVQELTTERVAKILGPEKAEAFAANRVHAQRFYDQTNDLDAVPAPEIQARIAAMQPEPGKAGFAEASSWYSAASKKANDVLKLRAADPAAAVDKLPDVQAAAQGASLDKPATFAPLAKARLTAMERVGIPEDNRIPITRAEALALWKPIELAVKSGDASEVRDMLKATATDAQAAFGEHADDVLAAVLREGKASRETSETAAAVLRKLARGEAPTRAETKAVESAQKNDTVRSAVAGVSSATDLNEDGMAGMGGKPSAPAEKTFPAPDAGAIGLLRRQPAMAAQFDAVYGPGAAAKVMKVTR